MPTTPSSGGGVTPLGPTTATFTAGASPGSLISLITGLQDGETITGVTPNDGRLAIAGGGTQLVVGLSASSAGSIAAVLTSSMGRTLNQAITVESASTVRRMAGFGGDHGNQIRPSDGTKNSFNARKRFYTPVAIPNPEVAYTGIHYNSGTEYDYPNDVTYHSAIELPDGTIHDMGAPVTVAPGPILAKSAKADGFTTPVGFYWVRTNGKVPTGGLWYYTDALRSANTGNMEEGVDLVDKAASGSIGNASQQMPAAALGVIGDMPASHRLVALAGDSLSQGIGGYSHAAAPELAKGILAGLVLETGIGSVIHLGRSGASALANRNTYTKRIALMLALGVTDILCDLGVNDMSGSSSAAALKSSLTTLFNAFKAALPTARIYQSNFTPYTTATAPITESNQTIPAAMQDGRRITFNADLRAGGMSSLINGFVEFAIPAQLESDANLWKAGFASNAGSPGAQQHPNGVGGTAIVAYAAVQNALAI